MQSALLLLLLASFAATDVMGLASNERNMFSSARRAFLQIPASVATVTIGTTVMGQQFVPLNTNLDDEDHIRACNCDKCLSKNRMAFRPPSAFAYDPRPVGGDNPSPVIASFNIQSVKTYERLEKDGFDLDSREEESARLSEALSSFSYPSSSGKATKKPGSNKEQSTNKTSR